MQPLALQVEYGLTGSYSLYVDDNHEIEAFPGGMSSGITFWHPSSFGVRIEAGWVQMKGLGKDFITVSKFEDGRLIITGEKIYSHITSQRLAIGASIHYHLIKKQHRLTFHAGEGLEIPLVIHSKFENSVFAWKNGDAKPYIGNCLYLNAGGGADRAFGHWRIGIAADVKTYIASIGEDKENLDDISNYIFFSTFEMIQYGLPIFSLHLDVSLGGASK